MDIQKFISSIYLGDRYCKNFVFDPSDQSIILTVDSISRIRSQSGNWENYIDEDIPDGKLVFKNVLNWSANPADKTPNDEIHSIKFLGKNPESGALFFELIIDHVDGLGNVCHIGIKIECESIFIVDPNKENSIIVH